MAVAPFKAFWDRCQLSNEHRYSSGRIGLETRLLSEIHSFLRLDPLLTPLLHHVTFSCGDLVNRQPAQQEDGSNNASPVTSHAQLNVNNVQNRMKTVSEILKEMTALPEMLQGLSDDEDEDGGNDDEDEFGLLEACASLEEEVVSREESKSEDEELDTHSLSMPSLQSFVTPRRVTTIEVIPDEECEKKPELSDWERVQKRLQSCQNKYETVRASRGQYVKKREQNVRTLDEETLELLQEASRGFQFKLNQVLDSVFNKKLDPKTFVPEELVSGVLVHLKEDLQPQLCLPPVAKKPHQRVKRAGSISSLSSFSSSSSSSSRSSSSSSSSSSYGTPKTRFSLTHRKAKLMRIDHSIDDSIHVYREQMKSAIDVADQTQEVILLREMLKQKEAALRSSKRKKY